MELNKNFNRIFGLNVANQWMEVNSNDFVQVELIGKCPVPPVWFEVT